MGGAGRLDRLISDSRSAQLVERGDPRGRRAPQRSARAGTGRRSHDGLHRRGRASIGRVSATGSVSTLRRRNLPVGLQPNEIAQPWSDGSGCFFGWRGWGTCLILSGREPGCAVVRRTAEPRPDGAAKHPSRAGTADTCRAGRTRPSWGRPVVNASGSRGAAVPRCRPHAHILGKNSLTRKSPAPEAIATLAIKAT